MSKQLPRRLSALLKKKGITISELGRRANLNRVTVSALLHGRDTNPTLETLEKLAKALDTTTQSLMGGAP